MDEDAVNPERIGDRRSKHETVYESRESDGDGHDKVKYGPDPVALLVLEHDHDACDCKKHDPDVGLDGEVEEIAPADGAVVTIGHGEHDSHTRTECEEGLECK